MTNETFTLNQFRNGKFEGSWAPVATVKEALDMAATLKVSGRGCVFTVESSTGTVVEVVDRSTER